jgi:Secretion system C-terminal sorting domain
MSHYGFSIPNGSTIGGVTASITRSASGLSLTIGILSITGTVQDNVVQLAGTGAMSTNQASGAFWGGSSTTVTYGSSSNTWGVALTPAIVSNPSFGLNLSANLAGGILLGIGLLPGASVSAISLNITYIPPGTLPISLEQWSVTTQGSTNILHWTAAVTDLPGEFIVQRSTNGTDWQDLATVAAPLNQSVYSYTDNAPPTGSPSYYRLQLQTPGQPDTWSTVQVIATRSVPHVNFYPNPFHDMITITGSQSIRKVVLRDVSGKTLWIQEFGGSSGSGTTNIQIPASTLPSGLYFVQVDGATYKLIKN